MLELMLELFELESEPGAASATGGETTLFFLSWRSKLLNSLGRRVLVVKKKADRERVVLTLKIDMVNGSH